MKNTFILGLMAAALVFTSCSSDDDETKDVPVASISLNASTAELIIGGNEAMATTTLTATVTPENATEQSVQWTSSDGTVATVTEEGVVTAVSEGTATITAAAKDGSGKTATCTVTVKQLILNKVLYYDGFNAQANNTPDLCNGYVKDMEGAGVANTTYTAGALVDFRNTYSQEHDGGAYKDYENELWPNKTSQYDHSGGMKEGGKPIHMYPCVTPGSEQSTADAWFQINDIQVFGSSAIQFGFAAFGVDGPSVVDYTFKYKFDNQTEWTVYKAFRVQQYWQWITLDRIIVPTGAKSVSLRGEAADKNYIRLDDFTLVGDDDGVK